jgi:hypothetical protein
MPFWLQFEEVTGEPGTFALVDTKVKGKGNGKLGHAFSPGRNNRLATEFATIYLKSTAVDGPPGDDVTLTIDVSFKPRAAGASGQTYNLLVIATHDDGQQDLVDPAGQLTVLPAKP